MNIEINRIQYPDNVTRQSVRDAGWWNSTDHPLQDNSNVKISIQSDLEFQTWEGLGGAVSELGWQAILKLGESKQREFLEACFCKEKGMGIDWLRLPVGASDFHLKARSFSEVPEDYDMVHFSIEEDKKLLIPYIKAALSVNPDIKIHASPWSPPAWMKKSGNMCGAENGEIRDEERVLKAYAIYFRKFIQSYQEEGITIHRLFVQNEMDSAFVFPTCQWSTELFVRFHLEYLKPEFEKHQIKSEVWAGTYRTISGVQAHECFQNEAFRDFVKGVGVQYSYPQAIQDFHTLYPDVPIMHTESVCHDGQNSDSQAVSQLDDYIGYMKSHVSSFSYWNMVLEKDQASTWTWKQNSLCTVDVEQRALVYNPDYFIYKKLMDGIQLQSKRIMSFSYMMDTLCMKNPDGSMVLLCKNLEGPRRAELDIDGKSHWVDLTGHSVCVIQIAN